MLKLPDLLQALPYARSLQDLAHHLLNTVGCHCEDAVLVPSWVASSNLTALRQTARFVDMLGGTALSLTH